MKDSNVVMLDLDGVLVNFHEGVYRLYNQPYKYENKFQIYDFWEEWPIEVTRKEIMDKCDANFWMNLEWMHDGRDILNCVLEHFDINQVYLLTSPIIGGPDAVTGKMNWILKNIPEFYRRTILTCAPKGLLAGSDVLLIDDFDHNIESFKEAGGHTIQICRPWNKNHAAATDALTIFQIQMRKVTNVKRHTNQV